MIRAARYLGVAPWELAERPSYWRNWALACENAENWAESEMIKRERFNVQ